MNSIDERDLIAPNYVSRNRISDDSATLAYRFPVRWLVRLISLEQQLTRGMIIKIMLSNHDTIYQFWSRYQRNRLIQGETETERCRVVGTYTSVKNLESS